MKKVIFLLLVMVIVLLVTSCSSGGDNPLPSPTKENPYSFTLSSLNEEIYSLTDFDGKVVVLYYFRLNCTFCSQMIPVVLKLSKEYEDVVFLMVNYRDSTQKIIPYLSKFNVDIPVLLDSDGNYATKVGVYALPTTIIFSSVGTLEDRIIGAVSEQKLRQVIEKVLDY